MDLARTRSDSNAYDPFIDTFYHLAHSNYFYFSCRILLIRYSYALETLWTLASIQCLFSREYLPLEGLFQVGTKTEVSQVDQQAGLGKESTAEGIKQLIGLAHTWAVLGYDTREAF